MNTNQKIFERLALEFEDLDCRSEEEISKYLKEKQEVERLEQEVFNSYKFNFK